MGSNQTAPVLFWFRQDLRLADNPALSAAIATGQPVIPIYILDDENAGAWKPGAASRVWLHHSLTALNASLNGTLRCFRGKADDILPRLIAETGAAELFWNRCYEPWRIRRDIKIKDTLSVPCRSENGSLLWEPWDIQKQDGTPYRVFTPYFRKGCLSAPPPRVPLPAPPNLLSLMPRVSPFKEETNIDGLALLPRSPRWDIPMTEGWNIGETGAVKRLADFLADGLKGYKEGRNYPAKNNTSRLSPHLHFGEISPNRIWYDSQAAEVALGAEGDADCFRSELGWREFSHSLLYYNPTLPEEPLNKKFERFDWAGVDEESLEKWRRGKTGFPIVDAGMRELWATGTMHNRVRMIVASFLVKDLRYHWRIGEDWFWDTLFDASLANNAASWQWVAGCGADAAPYFRIFNPTTQGEKFDPTGAYIKKQAPDSVFLKPMLNHASARERALEAFKGMDL